jgi:hypothetical protein
MSNYGSWSVRPRERSVGTDMGGDPIGDTPGVIARWRTEEERQPGSSDSGNDPVAYPSPDIETRGLDEHMRSDAFGDIITIVRRSHHGVEGESFVANQRGNKRAR